MTNTCENITISNQPRNWQEKKYNSSFIALSDLILFGKLMTVHCCKGVRTCKNNLERCVLRVRTDEPLHQPKYHCREVGQKMMKGRNGKEKNKEGKRACWLFQHHELSCACVGWKKERWGQELWWEQWFHFWHQPPLNLSVWRCWKWRPSQENKVWQSPSLIITRFGPNILIDFLRKENWIRCEQTWPQNPVWRQLFSPCQVKAWAGCQDLECFTIKTIQKVETCHNHAGRVFLKELRLPQSWKKGFSYEVKPG